MNKIFILILCSLITISSYSQSFNGGVILGLSTSQVGGDDLSGFNKAGILTGLYTNKSITYKLNLQLELIYIQKGSHNPNMGIADHNDYQKLDISLSYIEVPFLLQYHQNSFIKIESGILASYLINAYYNDLYGPLTDNNMYLMDLFKTQDVGVLLGISYQFSPKYSLNTRISNSILTISKTNLKGAKGLYNSVISFTINYHV